MRNPDAVMPALAGTCGTSRRRPAVGKLWSCGGYGEP